MHEVQLSRHRLIVRALLALVVLVSLQPANAVRAEPVHVLVSVPPGANEPAGFAELLSAWRHSGQASNVLRLDATQSAGSGFATLVMLEFPGERPYEAWVREERPKLGSPLVVNRADLFAKGEITPRDSNRSVFQVNTYLPTVSASEYRAFVDGYITPLMEGQRAAKILVGYWMYLEQGKVGEAQSHLVLEYRDPVALARAPAVKTEVRAHLTATHPTYPKYHQTKDGLRKDVTETSARYTELVPPDLDALPPYEPEFPVVGGLRIVGSELKNAVDQLAEGFVRFHPAAKVSTSHIPSSEGGIAALYLGLSEVAPMGDDAKITDMMPFHNTYGYMPTEISVATGGYEKRGSLFAWAIVVHQDNPLETISVEELVRVFGAERSGGWELVDGNYLFTSRLGRPASQNLRKWGQLGLKGDYANREIQTFGYAAPGFATYFERNWFHWSKKWNGNFMEYVEAKQATPDAAGKAVASTTALEELARNRYAIGIAALMHVKNQPGIKVVKVSRTRGGEGVALTPANVADRSYPLIRDAFFYVNKPLGGKLDPKAREFMRFVLSREGQQIIARVGYYYPLSAAYLKEQRAKLD